jgi:AcrR family transcriptional regulator
MPETIVRPTHLSNDFSPVDVRILETFEQAARDIGPRHVAMARLASEMGISTKTLYRHFPAKSDLVTSLMRYRISGWKAMRDTQLAAKMPALQRIHRLAASWIAYVTSFSPDFWRQLARDYPEAQAIVEDEYANFMSQGGRNLVAIVRDDLEPRIALHALKLLIERAADLHYCQQLNLAPATVLRQHLAIWAGGAVRPAEIVALETEPWPGKP